MRLHCEFSTPIARTDLDDYLRHLVISVECFDKDINKTYVVGKLAMDQILWVDALTDGVPLFDICDNDSQGLHEAHGILTNGHDSFRPDLEIEEATSHVMFLYGAVPCSIRRSIPSARESLTRRSTSLARSRSP